MGDVFQLTPAPQSQKTLRADHRQAAKWLKKPDLAAEVRRALSRRTSSKPERAKPFGSMTTEERKAELRRIF